MPPVWCTRIAFTGALLQGDDVIWRHDGGGRHCALPRRLPCRVEMLTSHPEPSEWAQDDSGVAIPYPLLEQHLPPLGAAVAHLLAAAALLPLV